MHLLRRQPAAVVLDRDDAASASVLAALDDDGPVVLAARGEGVHRVLHELAQVDLGRAVQVVRQQVDDPAQIDLER